MPNPSQNLLIYGAGDHGLVVAETAVAAGWNVLGFLDDQPSIKQTGRWTVLEESALQHQDAHVIVAVGSNTARRHLCEKLLREKYPLATVIHPSAWISPSAKIGDGAYIGPNAAINAEAQLDDGVIINTGAIVEHHCLIGEYTHLAPHVALGGRVVVGRGCLIGIGTSICPSVRIGNDCTVGAGTVVIRDIPSQQTVVGVPARALKEIKEPAPSQRLVG
jgi:UDP-N-acetylbacillosamine N-acetyltransferase